MLEANMLQVKSSVRVRLPLYPMSLVLLKESVSESFPNTVWKACIILVTSNSRLTQVQNSVARAGDSTRATKHSQQTSKLEHWTYQIDTLPETALLEECCPIVAHCQSTASFHHHITYECHMSQQLWCGRSITTLIHHAT